LRNPESQFSTGMIKAIFFDLGGTIIPFDFQRGFTAMARHSPHSLEEIMRRVRSSDLFPRFEKGEIEPHRFVEQFCRQFDCHLDYERFCQLWGIIFLPETLIEESLLIGLKSRYRLFSLSNTNAIHFPLVMREYPILEHLHGHVLSYEVGALKPAPEIYRAALARAECRPQECLFIDDIARNIEGARRERMDGIVFKNAGQLNRDLAAHGIL
jgi:putative hydrolase of the HAD superfamily